MFNPYQAVMALDILVDGTRCDVKGTYLREASVGRYKGLHKVEINTLTFYLKEEKLMDFEAYMKVFNSDKSKLPEIAAGKLSFLEGDYKSGI